MLDLFPNSPLCAKQVSPLGPGNKVLAAKGYPTVIKFLKEIGLEVVEIDMSQIRAADGSLTCMSVFF